MFNNDNVEHLNINNINYLRFKKLLEYNINHCFVLNDLDFGENFYDSIKIVCNHFNFNREKLCKPKQVHSDNVKIIEDIVPELSETDGLITNKKDVPLAIRTADCIPIIIFDKTKKIIANIHSGWRGTLNTIVIKTSNIFINHYKSKIDDLLFFFGPSICQNCFEVDSDVQKLFYEKFKYLDNIDKIITKNAVKKKYFIDTVLLNVTLLKKIGISINNIYLSNICTRCNSKYIHSYRARKYNEFGLGITIVSL